MSLKVKSGINKEEENPAESVVDADNEGEDGDSIYSTFRNSIQVDLNTLFKFIKPFDGDRDKLVPFLNTADSAFKIASDEQTEILLAYTKAQLTGKAEAACSNHTFKTWDSLKEYLKSMYSDKKHHGHLLMELLNCRQMSGESIPQFMFRLETAQKRLLTSTQHNNTDPIELPGRIAAMNELALHTFILNVKPEISQMLRARNIESINEAFNIAIEEEKVQLLMRSQTAKVKVCGYCKKSGHLATNCFKKPNLSQSCSQNLPNQTHKSEIKPKSKTVFQASTSKFCKYCKNHGHLLSECRKRQRRNCTLSQNQPSSDKDNSGNVQSLDVSAATPRVLNQIAAININ